MESFKFLDNKRCIKSFEVLEYKTSSQSRYYKLKINLIDGSVLHGREYLSQAERNYAFHWQDNDDKLIIRWDNAPYHKEISTYPHHKHVGDKIEASDELTLNDVVTYIEQLIEHDQ